MLNSMPNKKCKTLDDINDILIVRRIAEREPTSISTKESLEEEIFCESDCDREHHLIVEEQEAIVKKQLQLLQADERGKQALISEIGAIKQKQEKRAELLRYRQHALDIEKERAKKMALLPPPLPKSVKLLLKKCDDEPKSDKPDVQMPDELKTFRIKEAEPYNENKENILDPKEVEAKQKMLGEWQMKAKKRFNEALKKDRQKEEYSKIMKQIQNAELLNRREIAKSISSEKKSLPCPLSDKFQNAKKQTDMEDAAEKVFKKMSNKEHVIEDIEGYQDYYEEKYKKIESDFETKMIDCIPSFVKENYEYLLEDELNFQGGKNFSGLDDTSSDLLNEAYIETPPDPGGLDGREKIDLAINQLDKLRSDLQTEYDQTLKPLLVAAIDVPKKELRDKAVETEIFKLSVEDKGVETDIPYKVEVTSPPPLPPSTDFKTGGLMSFKRRYNGPILGSFKEVYIPNMQHRDVHYTIPPAKQAERLTPSSWSSSSYCSLPSQHGIPCFPNSGESVKCDICVAEMKKEPLKDNLSHDLVQDSAPSIKEKSDKSAISSEKANFSGYIQQLAKKYLAAEDALESLDGESYSLTETASPAFEREKVSKSKMEFVQQQKAEEPFLTARNENVDIPDIVLKEDKITVPDSREILVMEDDILKGTQDKICDDIYGKIKDAKSPKSPVEYSEYDIEAKRIQLIQQVLARKIPRFTLDLSSKPLNTDDLAETCKDKQESESLSLPGPSGMNIKPHVYHELSTIQEMDSVLTADSLHASQSKLPNTSVIKQEKETIPKEIYNEDLEPSGERMKMASLLDPPDTSIAELAKSIHFITDTEEEAVQPIDVPQTLPSKHLDAAVSSKDGSLPSSLVSGLDSNSHSSVSSSGKVFSSSLVGNVKYPYLKDTKLLPSYFSDVSDIPKNSSSEKYDLSPSLPPSEFLSSFISSPVSSFNQYGPSVSNAKSKIKKNTVHSLMSGYIDSPVSSSNQSILYEINTISKGKKDTVHPLISGYIDSPESSSSQSCEVEIKSERGKDTLVSGYIDSLIPSSIHSIPFINDPKLEDKRDNIPSLISGYISNIGTSSNSRHFECMTPHSDISSPSVRNDAAKHHLNIGEKKYFTPSKRSIKYGQHSVQSSSSDSNGSFKPMSLCSIPSPSERVNITPQSDYHGYSSNSEIFKALTPVSIVSSPSERANFTPQSDYHGYSSNSEIFKALTPVSIVSSPSERANFTRQSNYQGFSSNSENFKALTPVSMVSSPSERANFTPQSDYHCYSSNVENFKALSPVSMMPSPPLPDNGVEFKYKSASSGNSEFHPINVKLDLSTNSINSQSDANKSLSHLNYRITLKTPIADSLKYTKSLEVSGQKMIPATSSDIHSEKKIYGTKLQDNLHNQQNDSNEIKIKGNAKVCSSDFFVPQLCAADLPSSKANNNECCLEEGSLNEEFDKSGSLQKSIFDSQKTAFSTAANRSSRNEENLPKIKKTRTEYLSPREDIISQSSEKQGVAAKFQELNAREDAQNLEVGRDFKKQYSSLYAISSTSSSTENLSEISGSKVLYQSTPIKSIEELAQEPGILEEPDLTLITTEYSCKVDSPEKPREHSSASTSKHSFSEKLDCTLISSENECKTPTNQSPHFLGSADTPSMISFLHHEMSCMETNDVEDPMAADIPNLTPDVLERKTHTKENERTQFQRSEYKQRTKRLWSNLEEVRKRNLAEEKKKLMAVNRLKAKEFAKKLTPKRKI